MSVLDYRETWERRRAAAKIWEDAGLSIRVRNCLMNAGIFSVEQLCSWREAELLREPNLGRKSLTEIKVMLGERGLSLAGEAPKSRERLLVELYASLNGHLSRADQIRKQIASLEGGV